VSDRELRVPGEQPGTFRVVAESARVERGWHELVARRTNDDAKRAYRRLSDSPLERYPGRQFPLRGKLFAGVWEYEVGPGDRIFYVGDEERSCVYVGYAGPHAHPGDVL